MSGSIFVFGSNLSGIHGKGSALGAVRNHGAIPGIGVGPQGSSYAIPTKDCKLQSLPLPIIKLYVHQFLDYAEHRKDLQFKIVAIGCGLAGYKPEQIKPMFENAPWNCDLPPEFK